MRLRKFGFLGHYKRIRLEGINPVSIVNKCIKNDVTLRNLHRKNNIEVTADIIDDDLRKLRKLTGHSYKLTVLKEGGAIPVFRSMRANIITVAGAFLLGALIFYQSLFIAEIRIDGYKTISETSIRQTLQQAGLYEGAKKAEDYSFAKTALYNKHDRITWVSIFEEGRLLKINIAEAGKSEEKQFSEKKPVHIIAARSGMIEKILPLQGNAKVQKGDYVNKGDVLISGKYKYQSSDYSKGDGFFTMYSHAGGQVLAKVPKQQIYYFEKKERIKKPTGSAIRGIYIKLGDNEIDTAQSLCRYEASVRTEQKLIELIKPIPLKISLVKIGEVRLQETIQNREKINKVVDAAIRQYGKDELKKGEEIISKSIEYYEGESVIKASVLLEILEDIGVEKEIRIKKDRDDKSESKSRDEKT